ncbi:Poly-gamma-glutamate system protein [uncultured Desulfobacterium sp.]|uniref:Poly-gamma-glutamate system protein n=1 Tax=uncultured Desulfobacterium sp. TaxID=201089 RepID=A0A445N2R1_9BACT|nr:Poly-gamma-glutamate system protein [uncultured Desulfobacterium sp.]
MKKVYWRPTKVPRIILIVISMFAIAGMLSVEYFKVQNKQPYYDEKMLAARTMRKGIEEIKKQREKIVGPIDREVDPADSGIIGVPSSLITTNIGYLPAKQTTINPNWAAVMVDMLKEARVKKGDFVAMGLSGSFPAMNLAAYAAADALKLKIIAISTASGSTWGANVPEFTWLDMERVLEKAGIISCRSVAASLGGEKDNGMGLSKKAREAMLDAIKRNNLPYLEVSGVEESIEKRMSLFNEFAQGKRIAAYINIGGGRASVGPRIGKIRYSPGLNKRPSKYAIKIDSVTTRFAKQNVPIIHIYRIEQLADTYGLPKCPVSLPLVGGGHIFVKLEYNQILVGGSLILLLFISYLFLKLDIGYRIFGSRRITEAPTHPEPMV